MEKMQGLRMALDAVSFLLNGLPEGFISDSTQVVLVKIAEDVTRAIVEGLRNKS